MLLLLLRIASASAHWAPGIPTGWEDAPSTIAGFPNATADPWRYSDRLGLYKTLVTASAAALGGWQDPIWGLPLQFSWQHDTGRLLWSSAQPNTSITDRVNASSWWGNMNYFLSVIPFVSAVEAGLIPEGLTLLAPPPPPPHAPPTAAAVVGCTSYATCLRVAPNATIKWRTFMAAAKAGRVNRSEALVLLWDAHLHSLHEGIPLATPLLEFLPSAKEQAFGLSWANLVDFVVSPRAETPPTPAARACVCVCVRLGGSDGWVGASGGFGRPVRFLHSV